MKKKDYTAPSIELIEFEIEDSIAASGMVNEGAAFSEFIFD